MAVEKGAKTETVRRYIRWQDEEPTVYRVEWQEEAVVVEEVKDTGIGYRYECVTRLNPWEVQRWLRSRKCRRVKS